MVSFSFYGDLIIVVGRDHDNTEAAMVKEATELNSEGKKKKKENKNREEERHDALRERADIEDRSSGLQATLMQTSTAQGLDIVAQSFLSNART